MQKTSGLNSGFDFLHSNPVNHGSGFKDSFDCFNPLVKGHVQRTICIINHTFPIAWNKCRFVEKVLCFVFKSLAFVKKCHHYSNFGSSLIDLLSPSLSIDIFI
jgi:hypothetical protein